MHPTERILSRGEIEALVAAGRKVVIFDGLVLKVDAWIPYHPGGDKAILHMIGRDGTNEMRAFHSLETQQQMRKYKIGKIDEVWEDFLPPIQGGVFRSEEEQLHDLERTSRAHENQGCSGQESSAEPSPIFDPRVTVRRRRNSDDGRSESSATSLESLALEESSKPTRILVGDERTQWELQQDLNAFPSLDATTQGNIIKKYEELDVRLHEDGLYQCDYTGYLREAARYVTLGLISFLLLRAGWYALSAVFLGALWHQLVFTVHDAGHMGITHDFNIDTCIGIFIADFIGGLSVCWWKRNHNVHHIVTNSPEHDPDIQHMPFFAVSQRLFGSLRSTYYDRVMTFDAVAKLTLQVQHYLYYPILTFGRFNLYVLSWQYIVLGQGPRKGPARWHRYLEFAGQVFFWYWFGYLTVYKSIPNGWDRFNFVMISHAVTMLVHVQITLSHFAMSTSDFGVAESFPQRMLRTTMDVDCPEWLDFFHGGLQFQAVHHLFPRLPRHNLRRAQKYVIEFCKDVGIPYAVYGFAEGNGKVISRLGEVAKQARILAEVQRSMTAKDALDAH